MVKDLMPAVTIPEYLKKMILPGGIYAGYAVLESIDDIEVTCCFIYNN
jgi:DNA gyrase inhibitor GyrI